MPKLSREEVKLVLQMVDNDEKSGKLPHILAESMRLQILQKYGRASMKLINTRRNENDSDRKISTRIT